MEIISSNQVHQVTIFTYTNADVVSRKHVQMPFEESTTAVEPTPHMPFQRKLVEALSAFTRVNSGRKGRDEVKERLLREDSCETMIIMAAVQNFSYSIQEIAMCTIRVYQSGLVIANPALSKREAEDNDVSSVFMSNRGFDEIVKNGERLTTYQLYTKDGSMYEYSIESSGESNNSCVNDEIIAERSDLNEEKLDERRVLLRKEFEESGRLYDEYCKWTNQVSVEIVSASGFYVPNMFLRVPYGSHLMIRYQLKAIDGNNSVAVFKGLTNYVQSFPVLSNSIEFIVHFTMALVVVFFVAMLSFGGIECDLSQTVVLSILPLILMLKQVTPNELYSFNHQFTTMFNSKNIRKHGRLVLELSAIQLHNFGVTSFAGYGTVNLPTKPGAYDLKIETWKPTACSSVGEARSRMHDYYLGSCLDEIGPLESAPTAANEQHWLKKASMELFSKHDLHTNGSGTIKLRVNVTENYFRRNLIANCTPDESESELQRGLIRETVDEVLKRVRRNKRGRMAGVGMWVVSAEVTKNLSPRREKDATVQANVSRRAAEVLERVRSRRQVKLPNDTPFRYL
ncbi:hypothetical protein ACHAWX_006547 [Stephanocyclus meneghinianus]